MSAVEQWATFWAQNDAIDAQQNANSWKRYARDLEAELAKANAIIERADNACASNLAEKVVLRNELVKYAGNKSPLVADLIKTSTPTEIAKTKFMREEIHNHAVRVLGQTSSFDAVRDMAMRIIV